MISELKAILIGVAKLPQRDQHWIIKQLPEQALSTLIRLKGLDYLKEAKRFRELPIQTMTSHKQPADLPTICHELRGEDPLYIAIILKETSPDWMGSFLEQHKASGHILNHLQQTLPFIKPLAKQAVLQNWEAHQSFTHFLENDHGRSD